MTRRRWLLLRGLPLLALLGSSFVILYATWVGQVLSDPNPSGDAIVVHAGQSERLRHAFDLMEDGVAPTLIIMFGETKRSQNWFCGRTDPYEILCPTPEEATTRGEAVALGQLVDERGWDRIVVVTSDYHLRRAGYLDAKCSGATIVRSGSGQGVTRLEALSRLAKEMVAMGEAVIGSC